jgi:hypothetical protein
MRAASGHQFGGLTSSNDVENYKSEYMQGFANAFEDYLKLQSKQARSQCRLLGVIIACFGIHLLVGNISKP